MKNRKKKKSGKYIRSIILYSLAFIVSLMNFRKLYLLTLIFFALITINVIYLVYHSEDEKDYSELYEETNPSFRAKRDYDKKMKQRYKEYLSKIDKEFDYEDYDDEEGDDGDE